MSTNVTMSGSMSAAVVSVGTVTDSTSTAFSRLGGVQHLCRNRTGTDYILQC